MTRTDQLVAARAILLRHRPATTPVVLARNLGREAERITLTTLGALRPEDVDMLTLVLVGSCTTRHVAGAWGGARPLVYTPRGYERKADA